MEAVESQEYIPTPRLSMSVDEQRWIDEAIDDMSAHVRRLSLEIERPIKLNDDKDISAKLDVVIANGFKKLREKKIDDFADKLLDCLMGRGRDDDGPGHSLGYLFIRLYNTMEYVVAYKGRWRGKPFESCIPKDEATAQLKARKLM